MSDTIVGNRYILEDIIGAGKFGVVYKGRHRERERGEKVAIKTETGSAFKILRHEATVLNYLFCNGVRNIPVVYWFGQHVNMTCLIMSYYTCNLYDYVVNKGAMDKRKLGSIMIKCLHILESIHIHHVLHRDIKPQNFMVREGELYMIDFGLSTVFIDDDGKHVIKKDNDNILGTPRFISHFNHIGENISRRDDLMSLGYMYLYLQTENLPWDEHIQNHYESDLPLTSVKHPRNMDLTSSKSWNNLSKYTNDFSGIHMFLKYCYELKFDDKPNYSLLMELFLGPHV
jgi:serine/threonine protein kinase